MRSVVTSPPEARWRLRGIFGCNASISGLYRFGNIGCVSVQVPSLVGVLLVVGCWVQFPVKSAVNE